MDSAIVAQWVTIPNTDDLYQASVNGEIRSLDRVVVKLSRWGSPISATQLGKIIKPWSDSNGYMVVYVCCGGKRTAINVHRLVSFAFHGVPLTKKDVNHIDGNKKNNAKDNLEWCSRKENMMHAIATGLYDPKIGGRMTGGRNKKSVTGTPINGGEILHFESARNAGIVLNGGGGGNISSAISGKLKQAYGYYWKFFDV